MESCDSRCQQLWQQTILQEERITRRTAYVALGAGLSKFLVLYQEYHTFMFSRPYEYVLLARMYMFHDVHMFLSMRVDYASLSKYSCLT
jgi:hypothetical protein